MDLGSILSLGASLFGGGGSPAAAPSSGGGLDWGSILAAIGKTAGSFKATPNEGASRKDIEKANRFNLLAGLLGSGAQIAGGVMSQQRKGEAYNALADILGGKATTTGQAVTPSETGAVGATPTVTTQGPQSTASQMLALGKQYPEYADKFLELGIKQQESERSASQKLAELIRKSQPSIQDRAAISGMLKNEGILPEDIGAETARRAQEEYQRRLANLAGLSDVSPALRGLPGIPTEPIQTPPTVTTTPPPSSQMAQPASVDDVIQRAQRGEDVQMTESDLNKMIGQGTIERTSILNPDGTETFRAKKTAPSLLSPGTVSPAMGDTASERARQRMEEIRSQESKKTEDERYYRELRNKNEELQIKSQEYNLSAKPEEAAQRQSNVLRQDATPLLQASTALEQTRNLLNDPNATAENQAKALVTLQKLIDSSQVTQGEAETTRRSLLSAKDDLENFFRRYGGQSTKPYTQEQLSSLRNSAFQIGSVIRDRLENVNKQYNRQTKNMHPEKAPVDVELLSSVGKALSDLQSGIAGITPQPTATATPTPQSPIAGLGGPKEQQIQRMLQALPPGAKFIGVR